jgi:hypothetical protein
MTGHSGNRGKEQEWQAEAHRPGAAFRRSPGDCVSGKSEPGQLFVPFDTGFHNLSRCFQGMIADARTRAEPGKLRS